MALEERIGDVCTGVNEETISNRLQQRKFKSSTQDAAAPCCICQVQIDILVAGCDNNKERLKFMDGKTWCAGGIQ